MGLLAYNAKCSLSGMQTKPVSQRVRQLSFGLLAILFNFSVGKMQEVPFIWEIYAGQRIQTGFANGSGSAVKFNDPRGIAADPEGNVWIADRGNHVVRMLSSNGVVSTIAGSPGNAETVDGLGPVARFSGLTDLEVAPDGSIYVLDNGLVRRIETNGRVTTIAGNNNGSPLSVNVEQSANATALWDARGLAVASDGTIYVSLNSFIVRITTAGVASIFVHSGSPGITSSVLLIEDLEVDNADNLWFGTPQSGEFYRTTPAGIVDQLAIDTSQLSVQLRLFSGLAIDSANNLYVANTSFASLVKITPSGVASVVAVTNLANGEGSPAFQIPYGVTILPNGDLLVSDTGSHSLQRITPSGEVSVAAGVGPFTGIDGARTLAGFLAPDQIAYDGADTLYLNDHVMVRKISLSTGIVTTILGNRTDAIQVPMRNRIQDIELDADGNLYLSNFPLYAVSKLSPSGELTVLAGAADTRGYVDGDGPQARFGWPQGLAVDDEGNLFVADSFPNYLIRRISPDGNVTTFAGKYGRQGFDSGDDREDCLVDPDRLVMTPSGDLLVSDSTRIRRVQPDGSITAFVGKPNPETWEDFTADGVGTEAGLSRVEGMSIDSTGVVFFTNYLDQLIRKISPDGTVKTLNRDDIHLGEAHSGLLNLAGLVVDQQGRIIIVDRLARRIHIGISMQDGGRLANLSVLKDIGDTAGALTAGFVIEGEGEKPVLVRAVGPSLAEHGVSTGFLADPSLSLYSGADREIDRNNEWGDHPTLLDISARLGAFALVAGSADAALLTSIPSGLYTAVANTNPGEHGISLIEVYDGEVGSGLRLSNLSALTQVGPDTSRLIAGFVIAGNEAKTVLIRGVGPTLAAFGVPATLVLPDPRITLYAENTHLAQNDDWGGNPLLVAASQTVGAFPLPDTNSTDAALLVRLQPGVYSVHLESADSGSGQAIAEIYEVK